MKERGDHGFFSRCNLDFQKEGITIFGQYKESDDVYTFLFEKENDLTWKAGQHGLFSIIQLQPGMKISMSGPEGCLFRVLDIHDRRTQA